MGKTVITLRMADIAAWPDLAAGFCDLGFEQSLAYGLPAAARIGARAHAVALEREGRILAAALVRIKTLPGLGRGVAWIAAGPLVLPRTGPAPDAGDMSDILAALRGEYSVRQGHVLRLRLSATAFQDAQDVARIAAAAGFRPARRSAPYQSSVLDLKKDPGQLLNDLNGKWRTDLRHAQKAGIVLEQGDSAELRQRFLAMFETVKTAKGFRTDIPPAFHFGIEGPDYARDILIATKDGQDLAGIVIASAGATTTYLFGATADPGRALRAGYFLTWEGIALARGRGQRWYDLGGIDPKANPDVARFKTRMNGVPILSAAHDTDGGGPVPAVIRGLETLRARLRR